MKQASLICRFPVDVYCENWYDNRMTYLNIKLMWDHPGVLPEGGPGSRLLTKFNEYRENPTEKEAEEIVSFLEVNGPSCWQEIAAFAYRQKKHTESFHDVEDQISVSIPYDLWKFYILSTRYATLPMGHRNVLRFLLEPSTVASYEHKVAVFDYLNVYHVDHAQIAWSVFSEGVDAGTDIQNLRSFVRKYSATIWGGYLDNGLKQQDEKYVVVYAG